MLTEATKAFSGTSTQLIEFQNPSSSSATGARTAASRASRSARRGRRPSRLHSFHQALLFAIGLHDDLALYFIAKNEIVSQGQNIEYGVGLVNFSVLETGDKEGGQMEFFLTGNLVKPNICFKSIGGSFYVQR